MFLNLFKIATTRIHKFPQLQAQPLRLHQKTLNDSTDIFEIIFLTISFFPESNISVI